MTDYSPAKDDIMGDNCYCILYYFNCHPQIARVYETYAEAAAYLADPIINSDNYRIISGKKYSGQV